jgi:hypothetical protein
MKYQRKPLIVDAYQMLNGPLAPVLELQEGETPPPVDLNEYTVPAEWPSWLQQAWKIGRVKPPSQGAKAYELCRVITQHRGTLIVYRGNFIVRYDDVEFDVFHSKAFEKHFEAQA